MKHMILTAGVVLTAMSAMALSLADARGKSAAVIENPSEMTSVMKQLSAADQKSFVAEVNAQIAKLPGSAEDRASKAVAVNRAALKGSARGNVSALIAEIFATAPVETLSVLNESFAKDVLNRSADPTKTFTDAEFTTISKRVMAKVNERLAGSEDAGVRGGFAALMLVRASNGSPATLADELAATLGDKSAVAKSEWFPAAMAEKPDYDPMVAEKEVELPEPQLVILVMGPQQHFSLLAAVMSETISPLEATSGGFGDWSQIQPIDAGLNTLPRTTEAKPWNPDIPRGYDWQNPGR